MDKKRKGEAFDMSYLRHACQICALNGPDAMCSICAVQRQKSPDDPSNLLCRVCTKQFSALGYMKQHLVSPVHKVKLDKLAAMSGKSAPPRPDIYQRTSGANVAPAMSIGVPIVPIVRPARIPQSRARSTKLAHSPDTSDAEGSYDSRNDRSEEEEQTSMPCEICGGDGPEDDGVICDSCEKSFHFTCLDPPMQSVPSGPWMCPACEAEGLEASRRTRPRAAATPELSAESEILLDVYRRLVAGLADAQLLNDPSSQVTGAQILAYNTNAMLSIAPDQLAPPPWAGRVLTSIDPSMSEAQLAAALHQLKDEETLLEHQLVTETRHLQEQFALASAAGAGGVHPV
eukprot:m.232133 g.232133  ORF g.232133 m.232133 type:complete len:344 (+) comp18587_c0_seq1:102-1133(+)